MPKKEYDNFVVALINLKDMISTLKSHGNVIVFDDMSNIIYVTGGNSVFDKFVKITDENIFKSSRCFLFKLINTVNVVAFNKALKKTKTISKICKDGSIKFTTDGYDNELVLPQISELTMITSKYNVLFKKLDITKMIINIDPAEFIGISSNELDALRNNKLIYVTSATNNMMYISKSIFGNIKKTQRISHAVIDTNEFEEIVLFKQEEAGFEVYTLLKFLVT